MEQLKRKIIKTGDLYQVATRSGVSVDGSGASAWWPGEFGEFIFNHGEIFVVISNINDYVSFLTPKRGQFTVRTQSGYCLPWFLEIVK